jgi:hypothetical protein
MPLATARLATGRRLADDASGKEREMAAATRILALAAGAAWVAACGSEFQQNPDGLVPDGRIGEGVGWLDAAGDGARPPPNPYDPNNAFKDTDCDGLSDLEEFSIVYADGKKTDPAKPDSDGDGIPDGVEAGKGSSVDKYCKTFAGDADPATKTSPVLADSDGDGLPDGVEDANRNGKLDPGETDPASADSDGDGLPDGVEDANRNGKVDPGETDPRKKDTDGDKIGDGVELSSAWS